MDEHSIMQAVAVARGARNIEVFTGAGMSADSGLETYRDPETGVWSKVDPQAMASIDAWARDPEPMWAWYRWRAGQAMKARPNAGHETIAYWEGSHLVDAVHVTTQNIDNLHERAGSTEVTHLHGSLFEFRCSICSKPWRDDGDYPREPVERLAPPTCSLCGNPVRPGVVWFGEALPQEEWAVAERRMREADLVVIVGTSGIVYPAASLPVLAHQRGVPILEITPKETDLSRIATYSWRATAAEGLPALVRRLGV
ncbi:transcriptional regulator, Sir2 family [Corynebacterium efficiens YS-314]|uniref:NAD-dependent protein deacylase 2 n=1 Tax=Corynebacterium efficiens (strain DSM 44549 / YS-314 / AJ 12310 / JCM 11189 / NBRC 100395) TaxID=196164 RepID=NPD2_COREF|nr:NAD-dependent deacylase [Corynebacterium efficiens]Q8FRV5.2 RecName: Full=NAD-dependent protein deacylase 2; AltName: Full=Regulatory protein SIR2 homolog 2 [Corynebacterium efficiens YS-314]EEW50292.1 transcriptional regulator, Sir2 family [Corynebacterium efficiens YS-314]